jgi:hypothetical protein
LKRIEREPRYLYSLDKDGDILRSPVSAEVNGLERKKERNAKNRRIIQIKQFCCE